MNILEELDSMKAAFADLIGFEQAFIRCGQIKALIEQGTDPEAFQFEIKNFRAIAPQARFIKTAPYLEAYEKCCKLMKRMPHRRGLETYRNLMLTGKITIVHLARFEEQIINEGWNV